MRSNLVSESFLVTATVEFLRSIGGSASAASMIEYVMDIRRADPNLARLLAADVVSRDSRLKLTDDVVELVDCDHEAIDLGHTSYVVFDLETTGAKTPPCRVTEIGAYRVTGGEITAEFHTLVNPEMPIPFFITMLTGIDDGMVRDAPKFNEVAEDLLSFIGDSVLVAHNAHFDMRFLNHELGRVFEDCRLRNPALCTVQLSRKLLPNIDNHKLKTVAQYFSVELINHHRANADAFATAKIFVHLLEDLQSRGVRDLGTAREFDVKRDYVRSGEIATGEPAAARYQADAA